MCDPLRAAWARAAARWELVSGLGLTLGCTRDNEIGQDGDIGLESPADVPEVAAGYFWDCSAAIGLGGATFALPEGNGHTTFALLPTSATAFPTALSENGQRQFRMRKSVDAAPSSLATAGLVAAGWTGPTYLAGWFRLPDASGDVTGAGTLLGHFLATGNQRRLSWSLLSTTTPDCISSTNSVDGAVTTGLTTRWGPTPFVGGGWVWCEWVFDPALTLAAQTGDGSGVANKIKGFGNFTGLVRILGNVGDQTALFNATAAIQFASRAGNLANVDTIDFGGVIVYANGIPSLGNRIALSRYRAPV